jgi:hypothetical protein
VEVISNKIESYVNNYKRGEKALSFMWDFENEVIRKALNKGWIHRSTLNELAEKEFKETYEVNCEKTFDVGVEVGVAIIASAWFNLIEVHQVEHNE